MALTAGMSSYTDQQRLRDQQLYQQQQALMQQQAAGSTPPPPAPIAQQPGTTQYTDPRTGQAATYTQNPSMTTNLYSTGPQTIPGTGSTPQTTKASTTYVQGQGTISPAAYEQQQQSQLEATLAENAFKNRLGLLGISGSGTLPRETMGPGGGMSDAEAQARARAFAQAKELAGQNALAGLKSVQDQVLGQGLQGSSYEGQLAGNVIGGAQSGVNNVITQQLINDLARSGRIADETYQGNITQRGQDLARQQAMFSLLNVGRFY